PEDSGRRRCSRRWPDPSAWDRSRSRRWEARHTATDAAGSAAARRRWPARQSLSRDGRRRAPAPSPCDTCRPDFERHLAAPARRAALRQQTTSPLLTSLLQSAFCNLQCSLACLERALIGRAFAGGDQTLVGSVDLFEKVRVEARRALQPLGGDG